MNTNQKQIIHALTEEILAASSMHNQEATFPGFDPDRMDDKLKHYALLRDACRRIRHELEEIFTLEVMA